MARVLCAVLLLVVALVGAEPVLSDEGLESLVAGAYFPRTHDASLHELAHERAAYQVAYSGGVCEDSGSLTHDGLVTAEVLACNYTDPARAVEQWIGSLTHHALLSDPSYNLIGCGSALGVDGAIFYVCTLATASVAQPTPFQAPGPEGQPSNVGGSESTPLPALPNTAVPED